MIPRILAIAGSDSSGGAGIQADIKTVTMLGGYAMTAITAVTAQNSLGVRSVEALSKDMVAGQIAACLEDIGVDAVKIGMLGCEGIVRIVADALAGLPRTGEARFALVLDPVMIATSGSRLADDATIAAMRARLFPLSSVLTPNLPELEVLSGVALPTQGAVRDAAARLADETGAHVLAKGGHGSDPDKVTDLLVAPGGLTVTYESARIDTRHTHGTGCTLSSALATFLGAGIVIEEAVNRARRFVHAAIELAPEFGAGNGPLGHASVGRAKPRQTAGLKG